MDSSIPGLVLLYDVVSERRERRLLKEIDNQEWMTSLSRRVQHYGYKYDYGKKSASFNPGKGQTAPSMPRLIQKFSDRLESKYRLFNSESKIQCIVNEYTLGQGIGAHIDNIKSFGKVVCSLSLSGDSNMILTHKSTGEKVTLFLPRRSIVILKKEARYDWKHEIPKLKSYIDDNGNRIKKDSDWRRVSVTYRTMK